ncbi:MAG: polysaccharide biosynthesis tyrosine autokinase [Chloroflexi bacterium]|nr:polysaccharide biosynthesis tyrosine autokinase [Chloroflexota bacterium]
MGDFVELRQYITVIFRRWWILLLALIITVSIGYSVTKKQQPVYEAKATIIVGQSFKATNISRQEMQISEELAQTYAAIAQRQPVLQGTAETLDLDYGWQRLRGQVSGRLIAGTQLVEITVKAKSPEEATIIANEVTRQLILLSPTALQNQESADTIEFVNERLTNLQNKISDGQARLETLETTDVTNLSAEEVVQLQNEITSIERLMDDWESNYAQMLHFVDGKQSANYLAVIETAQANSRPVEPNEQLNLSVAAAIGIALGLTLIFVLEHFDDTLKLTDDLNQAVGLTPLGSIRKMKESGYPNALIVSKSKTQFSQESESYRMIRSNIQFMSMDEANNSILITSSVRGEGKSVAAANLGVVMAQAGHKTIVVDTDLRRPVQHEIFNLPNEKGLTDYLRASQADITDYLMDTQAPELKVLTSGVLPPNPSELLGSQRMKQVMNSLTETADIIIYDSPPAVIVADAAIMSKRVDGVVLIIEVGKTRRDLIKQAVFNLQQAEANIFGAVLNKVSKKRFRYYQGSSYKQETIEKYSEQLNFIRTPQWRKRLPFFSK